MTKNANDIVYQTVTLYHFKLPIFNRSCNFDAVYWAVIHHQLVSYSSSMLPVLSKDAHFCYVVYMLKNFVSNDCISSGDSHGWYGCSLVVMLPNPEKHVTSWITQLFQPWFIKFTFHSKVRSFVLHLYKLHSVQRLYFLYGPLRLGGTKSLWIQEAAGREI